MQEQMDIILIMAPSFMFALTMMATADLVRTSLYGVWQFVEESKGKFC